MAPTAWTHLHGTEDPMFPLEHGEALAREIPGARLLTLEETGHGVERADWPPIDHAILAHTVQGDRGWPPDDAKVRDRD